MARILLNTSASATSETFSVLRMDVSPSIIASGFASGEFAQLQVRQDSATWLNVVQSGENIRLNISNTLIPMDCTGEYRFTKGVTAGAVKITLHEGNVANI